MTVSMELLITGAREIGLNIGEEEQQKFLAYCELIKEWNKVINLVRYHNEEELFRAHFLDSLMCSRVYDLKLPTKVIDLGRSPDNHRFTHKNLILRFVMTKNRKHILTTLVMTFFQRFNADRNKLTSVRSSS